MSPRPTYTLVTLVHDTLFFSFFQKDVILCPRNDSTSTVLGTDPATQAPCNLLFSGKAVETYLPNSGAIPARLLKSPTAATTPTPTTITTAAAAAADATTTTTPTDTSTSTNATTKLRRHRHRRCRRRCCCGHHHHHHHDHHHQHHHHHCCCCFCCCCCCFTRTAPSLCREGGTFRRSRKCRYFESSVSPVQ